MMEPEIQKLLHELRESLAEALSESPRFGERLDALRKKGFNVQLSVDCQRGDEAEEAELAPAAAPGPVAFRMTSGDLQFLRGLGIDPTRSTRGLRRQRSREESGRER